MNSLRRRYIIHLIRVAAQKRATGELSDPWYGAAITKLMFRLAGSDLKAGDSISPIDFELAVPKALGLPTAYQWDSPELEREYGPYGQAPTFLKNATGDYTWDQQKADLARLACHAVSPPARLEAWAEGVKKTYPTLTAGGATFAWLILAAIAGGLATWWFTCKP